MVIYIMPFYALKLQHVFPKVKNNLLYTRIWASQVAEWVKHLPAMQKIQELCVWSLDREDPLEEGMATHSSILAWRIPRTEETGGYSP